MEKILDKLFKFNLEDLFVSETTKRIFVRKSNRIYFKNIEDKHYRIYRKFKNATKAKRFFKNFILRNNFTPMGRFYLSAK